MPDFFVPLDTSFVSDYYNKLVGRGILNLYALRYVDDHRDEIRSAYPSVNSYLENFMVGDDILEDLVAYGIEEGLPLSGEDFEISRERIRLLMKAYLARDLWNTSEFYQVINTSEPSVLKAIELLKSQEIYQALLEVK